MILITGASQGIGYACAKALLARTDAKVLITGRDAPRLAAAREGVPPSQRERLFTRVCDQGCHGDVHRLGTFIASREAELEGAILNVGINPAFREGPRRLHTVSAATIEDAVRTNCTHLLLLTGAILGTLWARRAGTVLWIGSRAPVVGMRGAAVYCASKAFLAGLARSTHNEYASRGVRVQLLHPSLVRTPRTAATVDRFAAAHGQPVHSADDVAASIVEHYLCPSGDAVEVNL